MQARRTRAYISTANIHRTFQRLILSLTPNPPIEGVSRPPGIMVLSRSTRYHATTSTASTAFDDHRWSQCRPAPSRHLGPAPRLSQLVQQRLDLGDAPGRANTGDKMMTLVASALAGGDCIDDADALRAGGTACVLGSAVKAPSTLGTFLRSFRWGHVRQLDRVSRELLARAWQAGAGPGDAPFTIDLDSTICETYGLDKEGARHHGYTGPGAITRCWPSPPEPATC